jgi:hypothetical protein
VADLLECLLQIKALREGPKRLANLVARHPAAAWYRADRTGKSAFDRLAYLASSERERLRWLQFALASSTAPTPAPSDGGEPAGQEGEIGELVAHCATLRQRALALLEQCDAAGFLRAAALDGRGRIAVADLIAIMLADDCDVIGAIGAALAGDRPVDRETP